MMLSKSLIRIGRLGPSIFRWVRGSLAATQTLEKSHPCLKYIRKKYFRTRHFFYDPDILEFIRSKNELKNKVFSSINAFKFPQKWVKLISEAQIRPYRNIIEDIFGPGSFNDSFYYNCLTQTKNQSTPIYDPLIPKNITNDYFTFMGVSKQEHSSANESYLNLLQYYSNEQSFIDQEDIISLRKEIADTKEVNCFATASKQEKEKLEQKKEILTEIDCEEKAVYEDLDVLKSQHILNSKKIKNPKRSSGTDEMDTVLDQLASRCLNSPTSKIDEQLLKEMKKCGTPNIPHKRRSRFTDKNVMQSDMKNEDKDRPVDLEFASVNDTSIFRGSVMEQLQLYLFKFSNTFFPRSVDVRKY